jgi:ATP-dependent Clp protease adaptor protein ClpS
MVPCGVSGLHGDAALNEVRNEHGSENASGAPAGNGPAAAVKDRPKNTPPKVDQLPPYRVLLHNDDKNDALHVIQTIVELTPLAKPQAIAATHEAHHTGVALLVVTHKERAELYRDQFASKSLTVTIEPAV